MISTYTDTFTLDSLTAPESVPFDNVLNPILDIDNIGWEQVPYLNVTMRVRVTILDGAENRSAKFRNPPQSSYGYLHIKSNEYVRDYIPLRFLDAEYLYRSEPIAIANNLSSRPMRFGMEAASGHWGWQNSTPGILCNNLVGPMVGAGQNLILTGGANLGAGSLQAIVKPGETTFRELPDSPAATQTELIVDPLELGLPNSYSGIIFPDVTIAITTDYLANVVVAVAPPETYPPFIVTSPTFPSYNYVCDNGLPTPLPTNPSCNPDDLVWGDPDNPVCGLFT
jgi:hypothetical protein